MAKRSNFTMLPHWLLDDSDLSLHELVVYMALLRFRDPETGKCWPGFTTIADRARVSRKTVQRVIPKLEARGMIRVRRRKDLTVNVSNEYEVALPTDVAGFDWSVSARGRRIPKRRKPTDSESLGSAEHSKPRAPESPPEDSQSASPRTPSPSKKTHEKNTHEEDLTRTFGESACDLFSFDETPTATEAQIAYLRDLVLQLHHEQANDLQIARWRKFTRPEATHQIRSYLRALGRPDEHEYPEYGSPEYEALSPAGKEFADTAGRPDSVWDYGFRLAENRSA
ncbi:helix-turn-helix domain-containing protein [Microbacterium sp. Marseille-Q6965]|uniref:helix-turn-helix domain-containing protein n=1 Tax=Microbacterium sp. Marseille-Q6965 TaxID=2965072 RepID=UPI0021B8090C|nr:helix-turn-helix domain-containing protein [Microbacterium sp. Marseille-Q6965]